jgi:hypothetical protein
MKAARYQPKNEVTAITFISKAQNVHFNMAN